MIHSQWGRLLVDEIESTKVAARTLRVWSLGGPSLAIKSQNAMVYVDPFFGDSSPPDWMRLIAVPMAPSDIAQADCVLSTHCHGDHCHRETLLEIAENNRDTVFAGPSSSVELMRQFVLPETGIKQVSHGDRWQVSDVEIHAIHGRDWADEHALCYVVISGDTAIFLGGDTLYFEGFKDYGDRFDITAAALAVAGPYKGQPIYLSPQESVQAAVDLGANLLLPTHWDLWRCVQLDPRTVITESARMGDPVQTNILGLGDSVLIG